MPFVPNTFLQLTASHYTGGIINALTRIMDLSNTADFLVNQAGYCPDIIQVHIYNHGTQCEYNHAASEVRLGWHACTPMGLRGPALPWQVGAESLLFELHNGLRAQAHQASLLDFNNNLITLLQHGLNLAHIESESSECTARCLNEAVAGGGIPPYVPSAWGQAHRAQYLANAGNYAIFFANQPHSTNPADPPTHHLLTKHMYAYNARILIPSFQGLCGNIINGPLIPPHGTPAPTGIFNIGARIQAADNGTFSNHGLVVYGIKALEDLQHQGWGIPWNTTVPGAWIAYANDVLANIPAADVAAVTPINLAPFITSITH